MTTISKRNCESAARWRRAETCARSVATLVAELQSATDPAAWIVRAPLVDGRRVGSLVVEAVRRAVGRLPRPVLAELLRAGNRVELWPTAALRCCDGEMCGGVTEQLGNAAYIGAGRDLREVTKATLHEIAHLLDGVGGRFSGTPEWLSVWTSELTAGRVPQFAGQREKASEYFAECCAVVWSGGQVSSAVGDFISALPRDVVSFRALRSF